MLSAMKKTLILTAFLSVLTFAAAQDTSGTSTDATSVTGTSTDATSTDATSTDTTTTDTTSTDATSTDGTSMDMSGTSTDGTSATDTTTTDTTSTDATSTDATSTDSSTTTSTDATSTDATSTDATSTTDTTSTDTTTTDTTATDTTATDGTSMAMMSPADAYAQAQALAAQADVAYPVAFYDRTLWKQSVNAAYMAAQGDASNRDYNAYLAQLYTKTQWWINAYNAWQKLGDLTDQEKDWAALSAAKLAYISLQNGNKDQARQYVTTGMAWKNTPSLQAIMTRL